MATYREKLLDPRWQKRRLEILERDGWACRECADASSTLHVHHVAYRSGADPWDYPDHMLVALCEECHERVKDDAYDLVSSLCASGIGQTRLGSVAWHLSISPAAKEIVDLFVAALDGGMLCRQEDVVAAATTLATAISGRVAEFAKSRPGSSVW